MTQQSALLLIPFLGGVVVAGKDHLDPLRSLSRMLGFTLGPFEAYLAMRGIEGGL